MTIGRTLRDFLADSRVDYNLVEHPWSEGSRETAEAALIPGDRLAKGVVLKHGDGYVLAVLPSSRRVDLRTLRQTLGRDLDLASEEQTEWLFRDCMAGAIPPTGLAYDIETVVDESLDRQPEVWFEAGDHRTLVHVDHEGFSRLMMEARYAQFCS